MKKLKKKCCKKYKKKGVSCKRCPKFACHRQGRDAEERQAFVLVQLGVPDLPEC